MSRRILILANSGDGLSLFRMELIAELKKYGEVYIAMPFDSRVEEVRASGCELIETPMERRGMNPLKDIGLYRTYKKLIRRLRPDLVITYTIKCNVYGGYAARRCGAAYAVNVTGLGTAFQGSGLLSKLVTFMNKAALKKAKVVFFENVGNRDVFVDLGIVEKERTHPLHGAGVNLDRYPLTEYPADTDTTRFLFTGRVMKEKGIGELFSAMSRLHGEGYACELHVLGGYEEDYKVDIDRYTAEGWLHYHGYVPDVRPYVASSHCFVLPSYHEGMANVNLECASMGRPVITTRIHGCMEAVDEGKSGLLCGKEDADSLYNAMKTFLSLPRETRAAMGQAGRARMEDVFDKKKVVGETVQALGLGDLSTEER